MILDTTFVVDILKKEERALERLNEMVAAGEPQLITVLTIFELFTGLVRSKQYPEEKNKIMKVLQGLEILPLDSHAAEKAGEIDGMLIKEGTMIKPIDSMIAGIALMRKETILTRDVRHFSKIKGVDVETY